MTELFLSIPLALLILLACHEAGRLIVRLISRDDLFDNSLDRSLARLALGYVAVGFIVAVLAYLRFLAAPWLWILFAILVLSALTFGRREIAETAGDFRAVWAKSRALPLNNLLLIVMAVALAMDFVLTCVPTTAWDSLTYHYTLPVRWLEARGFIPIPDICYHELPCGSEMLFALAFGLGGVGGVGGVGPDGVGGVGGVGALAANHLTWATGALVCVALIALTRRLGNENPEGSGRAWNSQTPGLIAAIAFLSLPIVYFEEMEGGYIDNFVVFLSLVMLIALLSWKEAKRALMLPVIGLLAGGLLASKHTGLFLDVLILLILIVWILRTPRANRPWAALGLAALLALIPPAIWYLKSFLNTGNPVYPFAHDLFRPGELAPDIMYWSNPAVHRTLWGFILYIPRLTWDESLVQIHFRLLSWYFLPLLPFVIYHCFSKGNGRTVGLLTWILILLIYLLAPGEPRYLLVAWGLYAALGAWGLLDSLRSWPRLVHVILPVLLILPIAFSLVDRTREVNRRVPTILGLATVEQYFEKSHDIWPLVNYINTKTHPDSGVVLVEPRCLYIERPYKIWYPFPTPPTHDWVSLSATALRDRWEELGIEYVLVTFGPNYRALGIVETYRSYERETTASEPLFDSIPGWVPSRASYAEAVLSGDGNESQGPDDLRPSRWWEYRFRYPDVEAILRLEDMNAAGYLEPVFVDQRAGTVFKIIYSEEDEE